MCLQIPQKTSRFLFHTRLRENAAGARLTRNLTGTCQRGWRGVGVEAGWHLPTSWVCVQNQCYTQPGLCSICCSLYPTCPVSLFLYFCYSLTICIFNVSWSLSFPTPALITVPLDHFFSLPPSPVPPPLSSTAMGCVFVTLSLIRVAHMNTGGRLLTGTKTTYSGFTTEEQPPNFNQRVQNLLFMSFSSFPSILTSPHSSWMTPHICIATAYPLVHRP